MATYEEALKEAFASAPICEIIYHCLEINHPDFTQPIRIVQGNDNVFARLEADAPIDSGEIVEFIGAPWDMKPPAVQEDRMPELELSFDNVSREITRYLSLASVGGQPLKVIYRIYTTSTLEIAPQIDPPIEMEINSATADVYMVTTKATLDDVFGSAFPVERYTHERFPSLNHSS